MSCVFSLLCPISGWRSLLWHSQNRDAIAWSSAAFADNFASDAINRFFNSSTSRSSACDNFGSSSSFAGIAFRWSNRAEVTSRESAPILSRLVVAMYPPKEGCPWPLLKGNWTMPTFVDVWKPDNNDRFKGILTEQWASLESHKWALANHRYPAPK